MISSRKTIASLELDLRESWFYPLIKQVKGELRKKGLFHDIDFWFSDEWFCPDKIAGVAIPFYLANRNLIHFHKKMAFEIEGETPASFLKLLRHECAHALDNIYGLRKKKKRQKLFGVSSKHYPSSYLPRPSKNEFVNYIYPSYGQSHPDEDFAETLALWLDPKGQWKKKYLHGKVREKLEYIDSLMKELRGVKPKNIKKRRVDEYTTFNFTIGKFYQKRRQSLFFSESGFLKSFIQENLSSRKGKYETAKILEKEKRVILKMLTKNSICPDQSFPVMQKMIAYCRSADLKLNKAHLKNDLGQKLVLNWSAVIKAREHRIRM